MEYRHSSLWPQMVERQGTRAETKAAALVSKHMPVPPTPVEHIPPSIDQVNAHMQQWVNAGWELVSANQSVHQFGHKICPVYGFFWRKD